MRYTILILFICLLNISIIKSDDDDIDEDISMDDTPIKSSSANIERGNVPTIKSASSNIYFEEQFQDKSKWQRWIKSQAKKDGVDENLAKYDGEWGFEIPQSSVYNDDYALILKSKARHHAISASLSKPFDFSTSPLVVQYEVKYQTNQECGGSYVKLLSNEGKHLDLQQVTDKTPYTIMFGPDMCGVDHKYHFIIRYRNPKTGVYSEHQAKKPTEALDSYFTDKKSHLYTLVLSADNSFKMYIDNKLINSGNLLEDMEPSIIPSKEIVDETDRKPDDWDDKEQIPDTSARKPSGKII
jgi:calnexin